MNIEVLEEAEKELEQAVAHHEEIEAGLGLRLKEDCLLYTSPSPRD